jgi:hypothetical protein
MATKIASAAQRKSSSGIADKTWRQSICRETYQKHAPVTSSLAAMIAAFSTLRDTTGAASPIRWQRWCSFDFLTLRMLPERAWLCKLVDMPPAKVGKLAPVTLGHMRSQGCRDLLVYCNSDRCNHSTIMNVGHLPDSTPIKSLGDGFVCTQCGHIGADVVPNWPTHAAPR